MDPVLLSWIRYRNGLRSILTNEGSVPFFSFLSGMSAICSALDLRAVDLGGLQKKLAQQRNDWNAG